MYVIIRPCVYKQLAARDARRTIFSPILCNEKIESTTRDVLDDTRNHASAYEAGVTYARARIDAGRSVEA